MNVHHILISGTWDALAKEPGDDTDFCICQRSDATHVSVFLVDAEACATPVQDFPITATTGYPEALAEAGRLSVEHGGLGIIDQFQHQADYMETRMGLLAANRKLHKLLVQGLSLMPLGTKVRADWVLAVSSLLGTADEFPARAGVLGLCQEGGCPHHGTDHVCVTPARREPAIKTFTAFCQHASGTGTVWIDNVKAVDAKQALILAPHRCAEDWEDVPVEHIRVLGLAEGDVEIVFWEDNT